jgi:hypothetical protein
MPHEAEISLMLLIGEVVAVLVIVRLFGMWDAWMARRSGGDE